MNGISQEIYTIFQMEKFGALLYAFSLAKIGSVIIRVVKRIPFIKVKK
jgi:hypothetical protein